MPRRFHIETFGCQMNELDSEKIAGNLAHNGLVRADSSREADLVILNTCSVREKAVQKVYARLGEMKRESSARENMLVGVVGCMAQLEGNRILQKAPFVNILAGPQKGHVLATLVEQADLTGKTAIDMRMDDDPEPLETVHVLRENPWRAAVTISEGCSRKCTFCVVPFTRGTERDRSAGSILGEVSDLASKGYREIVLLGQTVNSYRDPDDRALDFAVLLRRIAAIPGIRRVRFTSPHPSDFTDELLDVMVNCESVCNHVHLPVQSGSTRVLKAMRRGYSRKRYLETIRRIRSAPRRISVSTDIIVGFPGETEADFRETLTLLDEVQYEGVFSFKYSPRPNTEALALEDDVPEEEKGRRLATLQDQQRLIQYNSNAAYMGQTLEILVDDHARSRFAFSGRTSNNKIVNFDGPDELMGTFTRVRVTGFSANSLKGEWVAAEGSEK